MIDVGFDMYSEKAAVQNCGYEGINGDGMSIEGDIKEINCHHEMLLQKYFNL